jgi:hypothetical protein
MSISFDIPSSALSSASASTNSYDPLPKGKYDVTIFDIQADTVKSGENAGKPRWKIQLKVASGQFENRRLFTLIPLYVAGDFWKTQSFFEALGYDIQAGKFTVPEIADLLGKGVTARVTIREAQGDYPADNNVSGYEKPVASGAADLLASMGATAVDSKSPFDQTF